MKLSRAQADRLCQAALDLLRPALGLVIVDAFTDYKDEITEAPQAAETGLWDLAAGQHPRRRQHGMGVEVDPHDDEQWALLRTYAAWSINVDLWAEKWQGDLGTLHDCAHSVVLNLNPKKIATLTDTTVALGTWVPMLLQCSIDWPAGLPRGIVPAFTRHLARIVVRCREIRR